MKLFNYSHKMVRDTGLWGFWSHHHLLLLPGHSSLFSRFRVSSLGGSVHWLWMKALCELGIRNEELGIVVRRIKIRSAAEFWQRFARRIVISSVAEGLYWRTFIAWCEAALGHRFPSAHTRWFPQCSKDRGLRSGWRCRRNPRHQPPVTPNPQSLIPRYSSLLSNFRVRCVVAASPQIIYGATHEDGIPVTSH